MIISRFILIVIFIIAALTAGFMICLFAGVSKTKSSYEKQIEDKEQEAFLLEVKKSAVK